MKLLFYLFFNKKKFFIELFKKVPFESLLPYLQNFEDKFYNEIISRIPKQVFVDALNQRITEEKTQQINAIVEAVKQQKVFMDNLQKYDNQLDLNQKNIGDTVVVWDIISCSFNDEKNGSLYINGYTKEDLGECIVINESINEKLDVEIDNKNYSFLQNIVIFSKKLDKEIKINSVHVNIL